MLLRNESFSPNFTNRSALAWEHRLGFIWQDAEVRFDVSFVNLNQTTAFIFWFLKIFHLIGAESWKLTIHQSEFVVESFENIRKWFNYRSQKVFYLDGVQIINNNN